MASISINISNRKLASTLRGLNKVAGITFMDQLMRENAKATLAELKRATPKRFTGKTREAWRLRKLSPGRYQCVNRSPVMGYLENGTPAHGSPRGKLLFIPKTKAAHAAGARRALHDRRFKRGRSYVLKRKVKGIAPRRIVAKHRGVAAVAALAIVNRAIRKSL